ncbi:MAG: YidB family protein [Commensalibacter sp.]|nr:YidB family protein [Commensalibacter sp.]
MSSIIGNITGAVTGMIKDTALGNKITSQLQSSLTPSIIHVLTNYADKVGLSDKVQSWIGKDSNLPISEDDIKKLMANEQLKEFIDKIGIPTNILYPALAQFLPHAINNYTNENPDHDQGQDNSSSTQA